MRFSRRNNSRGVFGFFLDLFMLIIGIYIALWMENRVQDLQDNEKQNDYLYRLSVDLETDSEMLEIIVSKLETKTMKLNAGIEMIRSEEPQTLEQINDLITEMAILVMEQYFFTAQDYTYVSMRESGDFGLIRSEQIKSRLLRLYRNYQYLDELQENYQQALDSEFIPLWVQSYDFIENQVMSDTLQENLVFRNVLIFSLHETNQRLKKTIEINKNIAELNEILTDSDQKD